MADESGFPTTAAEFKSLPKEFFLALGRELFGSEPPPPGVRHFLPPVVREDILEAYNGDVRARGGDWRLAGLFDGFDPVNFPRYLLCVGEGDCLAPDLMSPDVCWFDPQLPLRAGDIGLLVVRMPPGLFPPVPHLITKSIQDRNGRLWACCNEADFPLSERIAEYGGSIQIGGRLVARITPELESHLVAGAVYVACREATTGL